MIYTVLQLSAQRAYVFEVGKRRANLRDALILGSTVIVFTLRTIPTVDETNGLINILIGNFQ